MKNNKSQITIFIIIAILTISIVVLFFIFMGGIQKQQPATPEVASIKNFVDECIYDSGESATYFIGLHGGYYLPAKISTSSGIPYYIKSNKNLMPNKENIGLEISKYIDEALPVCTGNFSEFQEFQITQGAIKTKTTILDNEIILDVEYPLTIIKDEEKSRIKNFENTKIPVALGAVYNTSSFIVQEHIQNVSEICMSCLLELQEKNQISVMKQTGENEIIYNLFSESYLFSNKKNAEPEKYLFRFAIELK